MKSTLTVVHRSSSINQNGKASGMMWLTTVRTQTMRGRPAQCCLTLCELHCQSLRNCTLAATELHSFPHDLLQQPAFTQPHYKYPNLILLFIASHFTANKFISNCREASGCSLPTPIDILTALIYTSSIGLRCLPQPHTSMQKHRANKHFQQLPKYPPPITCTS